MLQREPTLPAADRKDSKNLVWEEKKCASSLQGLKKSFCFPSPFSVSFVFAVGRMCFSSAGNGRFYIICGLEKGVFKIAITLGGWISLNEKWLSAWKTYWFLVVLLQISNSFEPVRMTSPLFLDFLAWPCQFSQNFLDFLATKVAFKFLIDFTTLRNKFLTTWVVFVSTFFPRDKKTGSPNRNFMQPNGLALLS